jgi:hypothetical protein
MESVVNAFDRYLDASPYRFGRTKHAVMGPVAKVLERAQTGHWSVEDLTGYALRVHEMNPRAKGFVSPEARMAMESGIRELVQLIQTVPVTVLANVLERLEYALYYRRRKRASEWFDGIKQEFVRFLHSRYDTVEALREAWKDKNADFDNAYPSRSSGAYRNAKGKRREDVDAFLSGRTGEDFEQEEDEL